MQSHAQGVLDGGAFESKYLRCELTLYDLLSLAGCSYKKSEYSTMYSVSAVQSAYIFDNCTVFHL